MPLKVGSKQAQTIEAFRDVVLARTRFATRLVLVRGNRYTNLVQANAGTSAAGQLLLEWMPCAFLQD